MREGDPKVELPTTSFTDDPSVISVPLATEPEPGTHLGQFRVEARIGRGGLGVVYRAYDVKLKREVALKVLLEASAATATKLLDEARAAAGLTHPSIATIHDVQQQQGIAFIVMELVPGTTLRAEIERGPMPVDVVLRRARDVAAGLARAHKSGIVHRDFKPENVIVTPEGASKILDFGLASRAPDAAPASGDERTSRVGGTLLYMAPEQARGERVDARADVFSLGVVLYEMLTGKRPFARSRPMAPDAWEITTPLAVAAPSTPDALARIVERCLAVDRSSRFADGGEVLEALRTVEASSASAPRRRALLWTALALVGIAALGVGVSRLDSRPHTEAASALPSVAASSNPPFVLTSTPVPIASAGLCSSFPFFADDGSIVFQRQDTSGSEIRRIDPVSHAEVALTDDHANSLRPAPGGPGDAVYMFRQKGIEGGSELRAVPISGGPHRVIGRGTDPFVAMGTLFMLQEDGRAIRRRPLGGTLEDVVDESDASELFGSLALSQDARWLATSESGMEGRFAVPLCIGEVGAGRGALDCTSAGLTTSLRSAFSRDASAVYFARGETMVRFDRSTHTSTTARITPAPTTFAFSPDGARLVFSSCRIAYVALRIELDGTTTTLPAVAHQIGLLNVGPRGELAFPVAHDLEASLGIADAAGASVRIMTGADHFVSEISFSPDGRRVVFHDATPDTGGLFVANVDGDVAPTRVTTADDDSAPSWLDLDHIVYLHAEKGLPFGRVTIVSAAGGEPKSLPKLPGVLLGAVPSRGTVLLGIRNPAGDRFVEATQDGKLRDIALRGAPKGMRWDVATAASPSGRYVAWYSNGAAWKADLEAGVATRVDFTWPAGEADSIQPDDLGRITVAFRHAEGALYEANGRFP